MSLIYFTKRICILMSMLHCWIYIITWDIILEICRGNLILYYLRIIQNLGILLLYRHPNIFSVPFNLLRNCKQPVRLSFYLFLRKFLLAFFCSWINPFSFFSSIHFNRTFTTNSGDISILQLISLFLRFTTAPLGL